MCGGKSFSATTNTLKELVEVVALHIDQDDHKKYFASHQKAAKKYQSRLEKRPITADVILSTPLFTWTITGLQPFTEIRRQAKIKPFPKLTTP